MTREDIDSDSFVSRRETIRAGLVGGLSIAGLIAPVTADEQSADAHEHPEDTAEQQPGADAEEQEAPADEQQPEEQEPTADEQPSEADAEEQAAEEDEQQPEDESGAETGGTAQVTITDQDTAGDSVVVSNVVLPDGGFISIHDQRRFDGQVAGSIIGITGYLEPGQHGSVSVPFFTANATAPGPGAGQDASGLVEDQQLIAIPHRDGNGSGQFEGSDPAYENGPSTLGQFGAVNDVANVRVTE